LDDRNKAKGKKAEANRRNRSERLYLGAFVCKELFVYAAPNKAIFDEALFILSIVHDCF